MNEENEYLITDKNLIITRINQIQFGLPKDIKICAAYNDFASDNKKYIDLYIDVEDKDTREEHKTKIRINGGSFEFFDLEGGD